MDPYARTISELEDDQQAFMYYLFTLLSSDSVGVIRSADIDISKEYYTRWKADSISLREFLYDGISDSWIDTTRLTTNSKYSSAKSFFAGI